MKQFNYSYQNGDVTVTGSINAYTAQAAKIRVANLMIQDGLAMGHAFRLTEVPDTYFEALMRRRECNDKLHQDCACNDKPITQEERGCNILLAAFLLVGVLAAFIMGYLIFHNR